MSENLDLEHPTAMRNLRKTEKAGNSTPAFSSIRVALHFPFGLINTSLDGGLRSLPIVATTGSGAFTDGDDRYKGSITERTDSAAAMGID
jgi:hypothetical protein